ncbi:protein of unknown function [Clostridium beijerinckii]|nr:protein of unknown function [Clostridium beijerinckii]
MRVRYRNLTLFFYYKFKNVKSTQIDVAKYLLKLYNKENKIYIFRAGRKSLPAV